MLAWQPLLIQKIEIHALNFVLLKLQLNRHRDAEVVAHDHGFAQLILYLSGEGVQQINRRSRRARAGDLFVIPAGVSHGFSVSGHSRPVCLVLDYKLENAGRIRSAHRNLSPSRLNELHVLLSRIPRKGRLTLADYPAILSVVARVLGHSTSTPPAASKLLEKLKESVGGKSRLGQIARAMGYHPDHLNRKLKSESGLGLRALRTRVRLEAAETALRTAASIADAANRCGFEDPSYFSRWFRRQTGHSPSRWRG